MQDVNVVVLFDSGVESTEQLALAAAVGAVQGRALIRLRRFHGTPESREYVTPREADAEWAHAVVIAGEPQEARTAGYVDILRGRKGLLVVKLEGATPDAARAEGRHAAERARACVRPDRTSSGGAADRS